MSFGDREFCANVSVSRRLQGAAGLASYPLWRWLDALRMADGPASCAEWITTPQRLSAFLSDAAEALDGAIPEILTSDSSVTIKLEQLLRADVEAEQERLRIRTHQSASAQAALAFWRGDFREVASLLEQFDHELTPAERKKLQYARRSLERDAV